MTRQEWDIKKLLVGLSAITSQSNSSILGRPSTNPHCKNIFSLMEWILETTEHCEHESFFLNQVGQEMSNQHSMLQTEQNSILL